jgi:hypothetical protein
VSAKAKTALLFFSALADAGGKNKCAVCAVGSLVLFLMVCWIFFRLWVTYYID